MIRERRPSRPARGATLNAESVRFDLPGTEADGDWLDARAAIDGEAPPLRTTVTVEHPRTIISRNASPDVPFDRSINPYRGCEHGLCLLTMSKRTGRLPRRLIAANVQRVQTRPMIGRLILLTLLLTGCNSSPSDEIIDRIETSVQMPRGAEPLTRYRRYYYRDGHAVIGTYILSSNPGREWRAKNKMILVLDGGCGVVNVVFSIAQKRVTYTDCNGVA